MLFRKPSNSHRRGSAENGICLLEGLLNSLVDCQLLRPLSQNLWIVCPADLHPQLTSLLSSSVLPRLPQERIISSHLSEASLLGCISFFARSSAADGLASNSTLLIVDACSYCSWPGTTQRFLAHSLLRNETCIARTSGASWAGPMPTRLVFHLEDDTYNARVAAVQQSSGSPEALGQHAVACPLLCIPSHRCGAVLRAAAESRTFLQMISLLLQSPLFSLPIDWCLWLGPDDGAQLLQAYTRLALQKSMRLVPAKHAQAAAEAQRAVQQEALYELSSTLCSGQPFNAMQGFGNPAAKAVRETPALYLAAQPHQARRQHPVYSTSNNAYGSKGPSPHELPLSWHGIRGDFTRKQATGKVVTSGLKTAVSNHAVADVLHEIGL